MCMYSGIYVYYVVVFGSRVQNERRYKYVTIHVCLVLSALF